MKIKVTEKSYDEVLSLPPRGHKMPIKQTMFWRRVLKAFSEPELKQVGFTCEKIGMDALDNDTPCLILMNHSSFIDLKIASCVLFPRQFHIVCTNDGFVGKEDLMRKIGCIPTKKFISDPTLIKYMRATLKKLNSSVLMYPEASYSFDGTATPLPDSIGKLLKLLGVPVVMIKTEGAFLRDPLYNGLKLRDVKVSATMEYLLSPETIKEKSVEELNAILKDKFTFDHFRQQYNNQIPVKEDFRGEGLERVLYKCPNCGAEGKMLSSGIGIKCTSCNKSYELTEYGKLQAAFGPTEYEFIPDWYKWERECVKKELSDGTYRLDTPVDIMMLVDYKSIYKVGEGNLLHTCDGFHLTGCDGKLDYKQQPESSYSLYSDYYWYEIGDMISIGDAKTQFYCFPKGEEVVVAKARLATEELFKMRQK